MTGSEALTCRPVTAARWEDLERLFGPTRGAHSGCWCLFFRARRAAFARLGPAGRKAAMRALVRANAVPGLIAYASGAAPDQEGDRPVGWVAVAPRGETPNLDRSPVAKPVDDQPVWSVTCFYVDRHWRSRGVLHALVEGAVAYARAQGAQMLEAYPVDPGPDGTVHRDSAYHGTASLFAAHGFVEVARRRAARPVMRRPIAGDSADF